MEGQRENGKMLKKKEHSAHGKQNRIEIASENKKNKAQHLFLKKMSPPSLQGCDI